MDRDLADSEAEGLSPDWRMNIAYNAALQAATAALAAAGERIGLVSDADAAAMRALAIKLRDDVVVWLEKHHPELLEAP